MAALLTAILAWSVSAAAQVPQADEDAAKAHFLAGSAYYEQANYTDAVKEFIEAHRLSKRPDLLYNISVCYERLGRWDDAIASLQQYLTERPEAPDRAVIESRIKNYEQRRDQEAAARAAVAPPPVAPAPAVTAPPPRRHVASWIVGGIGAGLLVAALGTGVTAHLTYNDLTTKCGGTVCPGTQTLKDEASFGRALTISTDVLLAAGAATLATGIILFIVEAKRKPAPPSSHAWVAPLAGDFQVRF
ncbi:MAG TPA: tetratricopeptide repeat protein [Polyangia bacterium]